MSNNLVLLKLFRPNDILLLKSTITNQIKNKKEDE
jgi:hypothetical protein